jgi:hypothetical protein
VEEEYGGGSKAVKLFLFYNVRCVCRHLSIHKMDFPYVDSFLNWLRHRTIN